MLQSAKAFLLVTLSPFEKIDAAPLRGSEFEIKAVTFGSLDGGVLPSSAVFVGLAVDPLGQSHIFVIVAWPTASLGRRRPLKFSYFPAQN